MKTVEREVVGEVGNRAMVGGFPVESLVAVLTAESGSSRLTFNLDRCLAGQAVAKG